MRPRRTRPRRLRGGQRQRREDPAALLGSPKTRERITALLGEATVAAAFSERHLIGELSTPIWRQLFATMEKLVRMSWAERQDFCARQSEVIRRLLALVVLDHDATMQVMSTKLGTS